MALPIAKRYARYYMDVGDVNVSKVKAPAAEGEVAKVLGFVAKMSKPLKAVGLPCADEHQAKRSLALEVSRAVFALLEQRKPVPMPLPRNATGDKGGYAY